MRRNPINDLKVGEKIEMTLYEYSTQTPPVNAYQIAARTEKKFKCRKVKNNLMTWTVERTK